MSQAGRERPVLLIAGPTASGKSAAALAAAEAFDGVVINADSMQLYRDLAILTARPGPDDLARAPHRLYGTVDGAERMSAARWRALAVAEIAEAHGAGRLPILVGGTGFYFRVLLEGMSPIPDVPAEIHQAAVERHAALGADAFFAELGERDPEMAARLEPGDSQRMIRAFEVLEATGVSLAEWQAQPAEGPPAGLRFALVSFEPPRDALYAACDVRFRAMIEAGAPGEVEALLARGLDPSLPVMKAVGVPELSAVLSGASDLDSAIAMGQRATRRYAKRQLTWFRNQPPPSTVPHIVIHEQYSQRCWGHFSNFIRHSVLTA